MGYADIPNLYSDQTILLFKECYALEKVHGLRSRLTFKRQASDLSTPEKCAEAYLKDKNLSVTADEFAKIISSGNDPNSLTMKDMKKFVPLLKEKYPHVDIPHFHSVFNSFCVARNQFAGWDINLFSGGAKHDSFVQLFDLNDLAQRMNANSYDELTVYGEVYGGKMQGMSHTYGLDMKFIAFEVKYGEYWLSVPQAEKIARNLGLDFVDYVKISTDINEIDAERDKPSSIALKLNLGEKQREGVVLKPLVEVKLNNGKRVMAKHKRADFCETKSKREIDPERAMALSDAQEIAEEWVTRMRLNHVIDAVASRLNLDMDELGMQHTPEIIKEMVADVYKESDIADTKDNRKAIGQYAAKIWLAYQKESLIK